MNEWRTPGEEQLGPQQNSTQQSPWKCTDHCSHGARHRGGQRSVISSGHGRCAEEGKRKRLTSQGDSDSTVLPLERRVMNQFKYEIECQRKKWHLRCHNLASHTHIMEAAQIAPEPTISNALLVQCNACESDHTSTRN